MPPKPV
ncbi:hypothetical protein VTN00DRAFT_2868 [Thermoascus crustaceus]